MMQKNKRTNLTGNIREVLEQRILCGELPPGSSMPSNAVLAEEFGVSLLTANRAVQQLVKAVLVYRQQGRGSFVSPDLPGRKKYRIGIADKISYPVVPLREAALDIRPRTSMRYLREHDCEVRLLDYEEVRDREILFREAENLDGIIMSSSYLDPVTAENLQQLRIPSVVNLHEWVSEWSVNQVIVDNAPGMRQAAERIVREDCSEIIVVYEDHRNGCIRKRMFCDAMTAAGFPAEKIRAVQVEEWAIQSGVPSFQLGMRLSREIRGKWLFSTSDIVSFAMLAAFREAGLTAGKDFQLISYDNLEGYGYQPLGEPFLTSIDCPKIRIAERSAELLLNKIQHPANETVIVRIPSSLVIRKSAFSRN